LSSALRAILQRFNPGLRLTGQQNLLLTDISKADARALENVLRVHGVQVDPENLGTRRDAMACPALPTCGLALAEAERVLPDVVRQIEGELGRLGIPERPLSVRMTGCPNGCARPYMGDIGFVGRSKDLYDVFLGGDWANTRLNWLYQTSVRLGDLPATIAPLLQRWRDEGRSSETFGDYCHRIGRDALLMKAQAS
jgi:sulfite reductase (ferredoxin)